MIIDATDDPTDITVAETDAPMDDEITWHGMDPNFSEPNSDVEPAGSESGSIPLYEDSDSDSDCFDTAHPALEPPCMEVTDDTTRATSFLHEGEPDSVDFDEGAAGASMADLPEVIQTLRKQLLAGYTHPIYPSPNDLRGRPLTPDEKLSLKHYIAWVESRGTVKGYHLHAQVLQEATQVEILSLYLVRKLAAKLTGLSSQLVDMCPKSCMAFTGEFKDYSSCTYVRDKSKGPCGEPRYDKKGSPRAQMQYTPIAPIIQSLYMNKETAEAMRYRHRRLQEALQKLKPNSPPTEYSDFSDSISHINHFCHSHLFKEETDTAITISGDGAQLTMKKQSDVWVLIVTILNLPPNMRSKAANIIMPLVIPGPSSPGNVESFVYVLYEELAKLSVGVWTKDALTGNFFLLKVYLCGVLGDMLGSAKLSRMAGHMARYGCRFSMVQGARPSKGDIMLYFFIIYLIPLPLVGAKYQYYPLSPPKQDDENGNDLNKDRPSFDPYHLPIREIENYWGTLKELDAAKGKKTQCADIVKKTGVSGVPTCATSLAFSHPFFFPLDPFHLFYENCMPHFWDTWTSKIPLSKTVHMSEDIAKKLGTEIESAMATLPPSFSGHIRNVEAKRSSQYKIYEWMALLHWYIVPIAWELGFNSEVVKNFALFSNIVEYSMTAVPRTQENLGMLYKKIVHFLQEYERLYVANDLSKITQCRLCIFQLIFIPHHITYNGTIRFGSQATCERAIGDIGHGIRSKKSPFKNISTYNTDKQSARLVHLIYPTLSEPEAKVQVQRTSLFKEIPITKKQREDDDLKAHLESIQAYVTGVIDPTQIKRWGKCPLPNNITLTSQLFEFNKKAPSRTSRYFEAQLRDVTQPSTQPKDQSNDETEIEVEVTKPIFGEALAFYTVAGTDLSLVVYHPLIERCKLHGRWYGQWSSSVYVLETSAIVSLIGIWVFNNHVHILRKHPKLNLLTSDEYGIDSEVSVE